MHCHYYHRRRGTSLIVMVATITAGAAIAGLAILLLLRVMGFNGTARDHLARTVAVAHLAQQFRRDAVAAFSAQASMESTDANQAPDASEPAPHSNRMLRFLLADDETITYTVTESSLTRLVEKKGERRHFERFAPAGLTVDALEVLPGDGGPAAVQFARLRLVRTVDKDIQELKPTRSIEIEAPIGRDHRFARREPSP